MSHYAEAITKQIGIKIRDNPVFLEYKTFLAVLTNMRRFKASLLSLERQTGISASHGFFFNTRATREGFSFSKAHSTRLFLTKRRGSTPPLWIETVPKNTHVKITIF